MTHVNPADSTVDLSLRVGPLTMDPHRLIYSTILLMTVYAIYDEGTDPLRAGPLIEIIGLSLAPLVALAMAHAFSDSLDLQIRNGRRLTGADRRHLFTANVQYVYVAVPPALLMIALALLGWNANDILALVLLLGLLSLGWWGWYAGRKAGVSRGRRAILAVNYALMGLLVILVELLLTH